MSRARLQRATWFVAGSCLGVLWGLAFQHSAVNAQELPLIQQEGRPSSSLSSGPLKFSARVGIDWFLRKNVGGSSHHGDTFQFDKTDVNIDYLIAEKLLARVVLRLDEALRQDGRTDVSPLQLKDLFQQVSIVAFHDENTWALGIKGIEFGKLSEVSFGQNRSREHRPIYTNNPVLEDVTRLDQAMGVLMTLDTQLINDLVQDIAVTVYDSQRDGFRFGQIDAFALRAVKRFFENRLQVTASYLFQGNHETHLGSEKRASLGFIYDLGGSEAWVEAVWIDGGRGDLSATRSAFTAGVSNTSLLTFADLGAEFNYVEDRQTDLIAFAKFRLKSGITVGPEFGYIWQDRKAGDQDGGYLGVRGEWTVGPAYGDDPDLFDVYGSNRVRD